jgi:hypothetical protein
MRERVVQEYLVFLVSHFFGSLFVRHCVFVAHL